MEPPPDPQVPAGDPLRGEVTILLGAMRAGDDDAESRLFDVVYAELRRRAGALMSGRASSHTLQPTALVHETYLRLLGGGTCPYADRAHFFGAASKAMRSILVDHARRRLARKRGGGAQRAALSGAASSPADLGREEILAVHDALDRLAAADPVQGRIVEMRYFGGLEFAEIAAALGMPERTLYRRWDKARAWLHREMTA